MDRGRLLKNKIERTIKKNKKNKKIKMFIKNLFPRIILNDINNINEENNRINKQLNINCDTISIPINKNTLPSCDCLTCHKIFVGYRYKQRMVQHCNSLNHSYQ